MLIVDAPGGGGGGIYYGGLELWILMPVAPLLFVPFLSIDHRSWNTGPVCKEVQHGASIFGTFEVGIEWSGIRAVWGLLPGACEPVSSYRSLV